jgi:GNAT superfamily N-acetyltransferase
MPDAVTTDVGDGAAAADMLDELTTLYAEVYAEPPYNETGPEHVAEFIERTTRQTQRPGFRIVWLRDGSTLAGFAFGFTMPSGAWWRGDATTPPDEILAGEKFAVIELVVGPHWRGRGLARRLMNELLAGRHEPYAILTAVPSAPARRIYEHWGWQQVGTAHHTPDAAIMDQLVLPLRA